MSTPTTFTLTRTFGDLPAELFAITISLLVEITCREEATTVNDLITMSTGAISSVWYRDLQASQINLGYDRVGFHVLLQTVRRDASPAVRAFCPSSDGPWVEDWDTLK